MGGKLGLPHRLAGLLKNQTKILWPKWKKLVKEFKNEKQERKKNGDKEKIN